jgi:hypothetical protein
LPVATKLREPNEKYLFDLLDPDRPAAGELDFDVTVRIELEGRGAGLKHWISTGKRPGAAFALETERSEPPLDLGTIRHDHVDVSGQVDARRPVGNGQSTDHDWTNREWAEGRIDDRRDLEHLLRGVRDVGCLLQLQPEGFEICAPGTFGHPGASPKTSRPFRRRPGLTIGPSAAGARVSTISA